MKVNLKKSALILALCPYLHLYAATASVTSPLSYTITASSVVYCGTQVENSPNLGSCSTVSLGTINDDVLPAYFPGAPNGYYQDPVTYATSSVANGIQLTATSSNPAGSNYFNLVGNVSGTSYSIPYYVAYQSCTQANRTNAYRLDPSTGTVNIPENESSVYGINNGPAPCNPAAGINPGNGSGALYFYINNGNEITTPIPADSTTPTLYQDTLTINVTAI